MCPAPFCGLPCPSWHSCRAEYGHVRAMGPARTLVWGVRSIMLGSTTLTLRRAGGESVHVVTGKPACVWLLKCESRHQLRQNHGIRYFPLVD